MKRPSKNKDRIFVSEATQIIKQELVEALGIPEQQAQEVARQATHSICVRFARNDIYIPIDSQFQASKRDFEIYEAWRGHNMDDLVERFKLSSVQIYKIIKIVRDIHRAKTEPQLPGFEDPASF